MRGSERCEVRSFLSPSAEARTSCPRGRRHPDQLIACEPRYATASAAATNVATVAMTLLSRKLPLVERRASNLASKLPETGAFFNLLPTFDCIHVADFSSNPRIPIGPNDRFYRDSSNAGNGVGFSEIGWAFSYVMLQQSRSAGRQ
jgi:hypothetical protein